MNGSVNIIIFPLNGYIFKLCYLSGEHPDTAKNLWKKMGRNFTYRLNSGGFSAGEYYVKLLHGKVNAYGKRGELNMVY